jgi:hypothetical protein
MRPNSAFCQPYFRSRKEALFHYLKPYVKKVTRGRPEPGPQDQVRETLPLQLHRRQVFPIYGSGADYSASIPLALARARLEPGRETKNATAVLGIQLTRARPEPRW